MDLGGHVFLSVIYTPVPSYEVCLGKLNHFKSHYERDRNHVGKDQDPRSISLEGIYQDVRVKNGVFVI